MSKITGVTSNTPKNILLGAGTIHKGLELSYSLTTDAALVNGKAYYTRSGASPNYTYLVVTNPTVSAIATYYEKSWNTAETLIGATSGGNKLTITPEIKDIEADNALVKAKGLSVKVGETANLEVNFLEITPDIMQALSLGQKKTGATSSFAGYDEIIAKAEIEAGDYVENLAFVGKTATGDPIIVIFDNALCTSGLTLEGKNKDNNVSPATFECYADLTSDLDVLPWHILSISHRAIDERRATDTYGREVQTSLPFY